MTPPSANTRIVLEMKATADALRHCVSQVRWFQHRNERRPFLP
jgi:hypothetical protein